MTALEPTPGQVALEAAAISRPDPQAAATER